MNEWAHAVLCPRETYIAMINGERNSLLALQYFTYPLPYLDAMAIR